MKKSPHSHPKKTPHKESSSLLSILRPYLKKRQGFTLIELMVAMAIIAILATAGIQAYTGYVKKGRDTARGEIAHKLNSSVMAYAASNGGKPPGDMAAFDSFLRSAGETFGGGSSGGIADVSALVKDPVGGKSVCLNAAGEATEPCAFHYTAYTDGTYAISYGVEDKSSTKENFYKTAYSVPASDDTANPPTTIATKYGVYVGTAPYIGQPATTAETDNAPVDPPSVVTRSYTSTQMNITTGSGGNISGGGDNSGECDAAGEECLDGTIFVSGSLRTTSSDLAGIYAWIDCAACGGTRQDLCWNEDGSWACSGNESNLASLACENSTANLKTDWRLPSKSELNELYINNGAIGGFDTSGTWPTGYYWSSEEFDNYTAWHQAFNLPDQQDPFGNKELPRSVRCVRTAQ